MPVTRQSQRPSSDQATAGSASEEPADSVDNTTQPQSQANVPKHSLLKRVSTFFTPKSATHNAISEPLPAWRAFHPTHVGLHLTQDPHPETNANHRKLPEEHRAAHKAAQQMVQAQQQHLLQPARQLRGPVPRNRVEEDGYVEGRSMAEQISRFRQSMDIDFLAPVERDVLHAMRRTRPSSHFRPLMNPAEEILLVHESDYELVRQVQGWIRPLPAKEKSTLAADLYDFLKEEKRYMLKLLLFHPTIRVTTKSRGQGLGMEEGEGPEDRPQNVVSFAQSAGSLNSGKEDGGKKSNKISTLKSSGINLAKTFELTVEKAPKLRGGGSGTNSTRSSSSYINSLRGSQYDRLDDDERVPGVMWWLAGGRGSAKGKRPTARELRERRRVEIENRHQVGFWGTVFGRRAVKRVEPAQRDVEEYEPAGDRQKAEIPQVDNEARKVEASSAPSTIAPDPAPEPGPTIAVEDEAGNEQREADSTSNLPAHGVMGDISNREPPPQSPIAQSTPADPGHYRDLQPQHDPVVEQEK